MAKSAKIAALQQIGREMKAGQRCARCGKEAPAQESSNFLSWEPLDAASQAVVCPDCITGGEQQAMDEQDMATAEIVDKVRENKARRAASRQGLKLIKSRRRDPMAIDYGGYMLANADNVVVAGELSTPFAMSLDDVESYLKGE